MRRGRQTLPELLRSCDLSPQLVKQAMLVLLQHNHAAAYTVRPDPDSLVLRPPYCVYQADLARTLSCLRQPRMLLHIRCGGAPSCWAAGRLGACAAAAAGAAAEAAARPRSLLGGPAQRALRPLPPAPAGQPAGRPASRDAAAPALPMRWQKQQRSSPRCTPQGGDG